MIQGDTIVAIASGTGGAISLIRISGPRAIEITQNIFEAQSGKSLESHKGFTLHYGVIKKDEMVLDDVLISLFRAPKSYTGEDMVEISSHASPYISQEIIHLAITAGARSATPGEFTLRAFINGKMDLSQAEAVADIIAADSQATHSLASKQIRGGYSERFKQLRDQLIELVSLLELELDFSEEDVEFADRSQLANIIISVQQNITTLIHSFKLGNIIKKGVPVAIVGQPNVGKSTLLNALLKEEKAIVSQIAGTTRDVIEDTVNINGISFRFIDTAGIRQTNDPLETIGIERTFERIEKASIILIMVDVQQSVEQITESINEIPSNQDQIKALLINKIDQVTQKELSAKMHSISNVITLPISTISAHNRYNIDSLETFLYESVNADKLLSSDNTIVFNVRHYEELQLAQVALDRAQESLSNNISSDLLSQDIRESLYHLGIITGDITTDDILGSIFSKFCIGK